METTKLYPVPASIALAVAIYYLNRDKQVTVEMLPIKGYMKDFHYIAYPSNYKWDKEADLKRIENACIEKGWNFISACGGVFFVSNKTHVFEIDGKTLPFAIRKVKKKI